MIPMRLIPVVVKQVIRHRTRSLLTAAGIGVAMFLFCAVDAMQTAARHASVASAAETKLIVYRKDRYCPFASRLPQSYENRIAKMSGVASAYPMQITVTNCRTSLDVVTFRGVSDEAFREHILPDLNWVNGSIDEWSRRSDAVALGETLARRRGLRVGDRFEAAGVNVFVAGVIRSDVPEHQNVAYSHLSFLQSASKNKQGGYVTQFNVRVTDPTQLDRVASIIDDEFRADQEPTHTRSETAFMASAAADILEMIRFTRWLGHGCLIAVLALVGNAIVLAVQDRIREHAVLQTLGYRGDMIARMILAEGVLISLVGGVFGSAVAAIVIWKGGFSLSVEGVNIPIAARPEVFLWGILICVALGAAAGMIPALQASRRTIAECFRAV